MNCNSRVGRKVEHLNSRWTQLGNARELIGPSFVQCHKATQNLDRNNKVYRNKKDGGWEKVSSKTCGNIVSKAIEIANRSVNS